MHITETPNDVLTTKPFDNQHQGSKQLHPDLLQPPFTLLLVGPKGSGKSNVILRLIYGNSKKRGCTTDNKHYKYYRHFFDKIYVFSPTWALDPKMQRCKIPDEQIFEDEDDYEEVLQTIVEGQMEDIKEDGKDEADHVLLIFSDLAGTKMFSNNRSILNKIAFNHRHLKVSSIVDSQSLRQINSSFRSNLSGIMLFAGITNRLEIKKVQDEFLGKYTEKEGREILQYTFKDDPYAFLYINFQKRGKLYKKFNELTIHAT
jgi:GTPase SAR1 family protein